MQRLTSINGKSVRCYAKFDSFGDFVTYCDEHRKSITPNAHGKTSKRFSGTRDFEHAEELARLGWEEGLKKCTDLLAQIEYKLFSMLKRRVPQYHYAGGCPDVGVFLANDPECFLSQTYVEDKGAGKLARIVVNCSASCGYTQDQLMIRGVAALAVVEAMEKQGRSCEVVLVQSVEMGGRVEIEIPLKRQGETIDMGRMAFALAHPSMLRRYIFAVEDILGTYRPGYGYPSDTYLDKGDLYFPQMNWNQCPRAPEALLAWVLEMLKAQGIELEDA